MDKLMTNVVPPVGPISGRICFVGEAPGEEEDRMVEPFVGEAGQFLKRVLAKKRIVYSDCLVTNIFNQRPPRNDIGYFYADKKSKTILTWEGMEHVERLRVWLGKVLGYRESTEKGPNVIVALGRTAMFHLTGKKRVYKWRGSILPCTLVPGFKVYVTLHPSGVMRSLEEEKVRLEGQKKERAMNALPLFEIDLDRILVQSEKATYEIPKRLFEINLSFGDLCARLERLLKDKPNMISCDIETLQGENGPVVWCIGFAVAADNSFTIPILRKGGFAWSLEEEATLWRLVSKVFLEATILKIFQGGMYDLAILGRYYGLRLAKGTYGDTMYAHHASYPYLWRGLDVLTSIYTWEPYYKDEGRINVGSRTDESEFLYNGKDCCVTREIYPVVTSNARELKTYEGYKRTMSILPCHLGMTIRGIRIDKEKKERLIVDFAAKAQDALEAVKKETGLDINLSSPAQKSKLLYGYLGMEIQFQRGTKKPTTDKNALNKLRRKYSEKSEGKIVKWILDYQKFAKLSSTYAEMKLDSDGRIRTSYSVVSTWRMNSSSSPFGGWTKEEREGGNLQNIPIRSEEGRMIRELFIPDEGKVFLAFDRRQAEAMVVAWESQDIERMKMFENKWDVHFFNAQQVFGIPTSIPYSKETLWKDVVTKEEHTLKEYRDIGKTIVHACVDEETEYLGLDGWKSLSDYDSKGEMIAVWNEDGEISFEFPQAFHAYEIEENLYSFTQGNYNQLVTANHKLPQKTKGRKEINVVSAKKAKTNSHWSYPISGIHKWKGRSLFNSLETQLFVAIQADLSIRDNGVVEGSFKKKRKIERLIEILTSLNIKYTSRKNENDFVSFYIPLQEGTKEIVTLLTPKKLFGSWLLGLGKEEKQIFLEELQWWDSRRNKGENSYQYYSIIKENADWVVTIAHLVGWEGSLYCRDNNTGFGSENNKELWTANISHYSFADGTNMRKELVPYKGMVYCFTTSTGYFLIRRKGVISITGNSNYGMGPYKLQEILALQGFIFEFRECKLFLETARLRNPYLLAWQRDIRDEVRTTRTLISAMGRKREFMGRFDANLYNAAYAFKPQNTVGELTEVTLQKVWENVEGYELLMNIHDEGFGQCKLSDLDRIKKEITSLASIPLNIKQRTLDIPLDFKMSEKNWGEMIEI